MDISSSVIPADSKNQAMDWSLVLLSQGIDTAIERDLESELWYLIVNTTDYQSALDAIRRYQIENHSSGQRWIRQLPGMGLIFDWRCAIPLLLFTLLFAVQASGRADLNGLGMMDNRAVHAGEWWRMFTAVLLHGDLSHLAANLTTGLLLIGLAMGLSGPGIALLISFLAGVSGNLAGLLFYSDAHRGLGASGMIMGALGLLVANWVGLLRYGLTRRQLAVRGVFGGCLLFFLLGFSSKPNVDILAHVAGFVTGLILGAALALAPPTLPRNPSINTLALTAWLGLIGYTGWLALR